METNNLKNQFAELYKKESNAIFRFCFLRVSDRDVAIDLTQDVFTRYLDYLLKNKEIESGRALLFAIARNIIIDWYRKKKNISLESLMSEDDNFLSKEAHFLQDNSNNNKIEMHAEAKLFVEKINEIDPKYREAVYLRFVEDLSPKEIAVVLKESTNVVSVHITRGLDQLRKILDI